MYSLNDVLSEKLFLFVFSRPYHNVHQHVHRCLVLADGPQDLGSSTHRITDESPDVHMRHIASKYILNNTFLIILLYFNQNPNSQFAVLLFVIGIHKLVIAPQILTSRTRSVLNDYNMSCDDTGKLILKPRPNN